MQKTIWIWALMAMLACGSVTLGGCQSMTVSPTDIEAGDEVQDNDINTNNEEGN